MITDCPDPKEVSDFHFLQLRTLRLAKGNERVPGNFVNIVAAASKFGLLFIGIEGGFKVLKLEVILTVDEDKDNKSIEENYLCSIVQCQTPSLLALSVSEKTLAVCSVNQLGTSICFYDVPSFANEDAHSQPYVTVPLKSNVTLCDFVWNPANEEFYTYCLSDGSLHVEELSGATVKPVASLPGANATAVCWSPKGKQLVAGQRNGSFTQYKPTLKEVKTVPPPQLEENALSISSICWISNTTYAVVYVSADVPYLFIVSTPKDSSVIYANFYDVCLGNNSGPQQKYFLHLEPLWGVLICASADSIEVAVLGDMPNWVQWDLKEDGKALLPGKDGANHPIGCAVMYSAQKKLVISESESYPPMPIMFFLTDNGLLVSYHMINSKSEAVSLVSPPLILESKRNVETISSAAEPGRMVLKRSSSSTVHPPVAAPTSSLLNSTFDPGSIQHPVSSSFNLGKPAVDQTFLHQNSKSQVDATPMSKSGENLFSQSNKRESFDLNDKNKPTQSLSRPWETTPVSQAHSPVITPENKSEVQSSRDSSYMTAIMSEIWSFTKELNDMKQLQSVAPCLDSLEDMAALKVFALNLQNFQKDISETMQSLSSDIFTLKNVLLESFVMVEEACSRDRRRNDHSYITMLKERALDPMTAKRMQKMNQHYQYLNTQLQEVNNKLDQDWVHFLSNKEKSARSNAGISSTEAIYKTIVNNQKIIHNLRKKVDALSKKAEEKKLRGISKNSNRGGYHKRSTQEDLSKLADEFLQVKIAYPEDKEPSTTKKLSLESQNYLKDFLKDANVVTVRPTAVYSPSQSRLLSNAITSDTSNSEVQLKDDYPKQILASATPKADAIPLVSSHCETPMTKTPTQLSLSFQNSRNESISPCAPVYEPITPPEVPCPPQHANEAFSSVITATPVSKGKNTLMPIFNSGITNTSTPDISVFKQKDPNSAGTALNPPIGNKPLTETNPHVSLFAAENIHKQVSSGAQVPPLVTPKALSFTSDIPKIVESTSKPLSSARTAPFAFAPSGPQTSTSIPETKLSGILTQMNSQFDPKSSVTTFMTDVGIPAPVQGTNSLITSESSAFQQQEVSNIPNSIFPSFTFGPSNAFGTTGTKSSPAVPSFTSFTPPENKTISSTNVSENKNSTEYFSFKPAVSESVNTSLTKKGEVSVSFAVVENESPSVMSNTPDKIIVIDTKAPISPQVISVQAASDHKTDILNKSIDANASLNQLNIASTQKSEYLVSTNSQTSVTNTFSNFSILKQSLTTTASSTSPQTPVISSVSGNGMTASNTSQMIGAESVTASPDAVVSNTPSTVITQTTVTAPSAVVTPATVTTPVTGITSTTETTTTVSTAASFTPVTNTANIISQPETTVSQSPPVARSLFFTQPVTTAPTPTVFGQNASVTSPVSPVKSDVPATKSDTVDTPSFGFKPAPLFGQTSVETPSFFGKSTAPEGSVFGQPAVTQSSVFGQSVSNSSFAQTSGGFFGQGQSFGVSSTTNTSDPSGQTAFSFGQSTFGQTTSSGSFGLAKSLFGQTTTAPSTQPTSPASSFSFGQTSNNNNNSVFGQGAFFSGLGGKPSEENANKNVFGFSNVIKPDNSLFGNSGPTSFGTKSGTFGGGSFSGGGGSVAQSGFGSFQQTTPQKTGGFGAAPAFGSVPSFGSPPTFGSPTSFGSGNALSSVFGSQQQQQPQANFSNFAAASSPTFGSLASQTPSFGSSSPPMSGGFGTAPNTSPFGSSSPFGGLFGGVSGQTSGFGSPSSTPANTSAFTQWRN